MALVGLVGRARAGKDTVAGLLGLPIVKLAQPVKDAVRVLYGWTDNHTEGHLKDLRDPRFDVTPREAMVHLTNAMKKLNGPKFFSHRFLENWDGKSAIITDVRYQEDLDMLHKYGAVFVRVERKGCSNHAHELPIDSLKVDYVIKNNGTMSELAEEITSLKRELKGHTLASRDR
jgi:hypothetical protein